MSSTKKITKLEEKKRSVNFAAKVSSAKLETIGSEMCIQPRFASHTLSSLMKTRTPINQKKSSSIRDARASKRTQKNITYKRQSGVYKRRSVSKQNKSMRTLVTILKKREKKDHRTSASHQDSELTGIQGVYECADYSLVFLPSDLTKDVSRDLKKCAASPAKSMVSCSKLFSAKIVDQFEKRVQDSHTRLQEKMRHIDSYLSPCLKSNIENIRDNVKDPMVVNIACQSQSSEEEEKFAKSLHREVKVLHSPSKPAERLVEDFPNEDCSAIETQIRQNMSANIKDAPVDLKYAFRCGNRKTWAIRKTGTRHVDTDHTYNADLQGSQNFKLKYVDNSRNKDDRSIVNYATRKDTFQRNLGFINQRVWKPPGITKSSIIKSTISLTQSTSQKWSRSTDRSIASTENKYSSIKHIEMLNSESTSISVNQSKMLMKENQDPCVNRATKICEHPIETKQRQRLSSRGTLPKKRHSITKVNSKTSNNYNNANPTRSRSKSRSRNKQSHTKFIASYNRRSRPLEVIHALKEIINSTRENEDIEENDVNVSNNDVFNNKEDDDSLLSIRDVSMKISRDDETHFNEPNRSFDQLDWKSINTQTEQDLDSTEILKLTQISMQSSNCNNVIEIGCNTTHCNDICKDAEISCNLIDLTNSETDIDSTAIGDKTLISKDVSVQTESIMHVENNVEYKYSDKNKQNLNTETTSVSETKLQTYGIMEETSAKMTSFIRDKKKIINENSQTFLLPRNSDDKMNIDTRQAFIKYSNDSVNNLFLEKSQRSSSSVYDYEASCSSEDLVEHLENDIQHGNIVMSELNIPSDVIAAFELAAERARNLHKAIIYYENLISKETEKRKETEDFETIEKRVSFVNCEVANEKRSECDTKYCRFDAANGKDIDEFSTYSSTSSKSDQMYEAALQKLSLANYCEHMNKKKIKLAELMQGMQEEYALEVLESKENENDDKNCNTTGTIQTLALPMIIEKTSIISCGNLLILIYCILYSIVFWYLQASF